MATAKANKKNPAEPDETLNGSQAELVIACGDKLTIESIADFARRLQEGLAAADKVVIDFTETVEVDITALQLFCSACRTATAAGKEFTHGGRLPQPLIDLAVAAGSERRDHCANNTSCFYKVGGTL